jgi:hypothetical protein
MKAEISKKLVEDLKSSGVIFGAEYIKKDGTTTKD